MAVILDIDSGGKHYNKYWLNFCTEADKQASLDFVEYKKKKERDYLIEVVKSGKQPFWGRTLELKRPESMVPKCLRLEKGTELPDYIHESVTGKLVSQRMKDAIESEEPAGDGFTFFPIAIKNADGTDYPARYYVWHVHRKVDAIDASFGGLETVSGEPDGRHSWTYVADGIPKSRERLAVRKNVIQDMAVWHDYRFHWYCVFVRDSLFEKMKALGLTGYRAQSEWAEV
ncbi:DUF1629 domain-containing protein [Thalassococcus sp. CAU 1522]|uniref:DUF1629 domain-containing protein n=1 Tax=Thalassococcus arenae TaxID=2851652 RepID=A0ABS6N9W3_9RHOB|nr:DUF1629 domain-containing protein [Thalassococcus arenae]MBV2360784.1 DUF1629 domain-containing protein [Thalassococcus arenae]